ncbi:terminase family protein [Flavobacterium sp.]|uniref:terminase large subunit domain-containing protein n=1 Tax=Flavobacterium sp. TaxID=239 RepID=UPI0026230A7C|nr:terminase family protein [Flavobacterium sp.]
MELLEHQASFILSDAVHTGLVGGYRSGKSMAGVIKTIIKKLKYPKIDVAYYLPTYGLVRDIAYPKFAEIMDKFGLSYVLNKSDHEFITPYGKIIMRSLDNPDTIVGYEVGYSCIDEADILSIPHMNDAFTKVVARLSIPLPDEKANSLDFVSTPEGFKFLYDFFVKKPHKNKVLIKALTKNNPFISNSYIETLMMSYTPQQLEAYLNGEFVNLTSGNVYHRFDRIRNHSARTIQQNDVLHIGMDFNVEKMNAVIHVVDEKEITWRMYNEFGEDNVIIKTVRIKTAVDEIVNAYDTADIIKLIKDKYHGYRIIIYPDSSGDYRKSSSSKSDIDLLKGAGFVVRKLSKNPFVKDRVNAVNLGFLDTAGNIIYYVNTDYCANYTEALERQTYKNGEPDKSSGFDHITEAGGYFVYYDSKPTNTWGSSSSI